MSTKTSFKRIALVAASALAIAGFSAVPAHADGVTAQALVTSLGLANTTTSPTSGTAVVVNLGGVTTTAAGETDADTLAFRGYLSSYPAGGFVQTTANATAVGTDGEFFTAALSAEAASGNTYTTTITTAALNLGTTTVASATVGVAKYSFTPNKAGVYVLTVWADSNGDSLISLGEAVQTVSITVAAPAGWAAGGTTVLQAGATANELSTTTTDAVAHSAVNTLGTKVGSILVTIRDTDGALYVGQDVTATVAGAGFVGGSSADVTGGTTGTEQDTADGTAVVTRTKTVTDTTGTVAFGVWGDGTSGTSTVTISVTDQVSGATTVIGTESFTFYGDIAKLEISTKYYTIGKAGSTTGAIDANLAARTEAGEVTNTGALNALATKPAFIVKVTDSAGRVANLATGVPAISSSNGNVVTGGTCVLDDGSSATYSSGGTGFYNCNFDTSSAAVSGGKATLTVKTLDPADGVTYLTATLDVTVGGSVSTETVSFDKTSYYAGEAIVVTRSAKDSAGNPVADGVAAPAITFSKSMGGSAIGASTYTNGTKATSATAPTVFAPAVAGDFIAQATSGATGSPTITATATVEADQSGSLALDAANAATDAANNAYDEAQNATQAASDALAAVTALAAQVKSLIASVKKLTAAVAKLKK